MILEEKIYKIKELAEWFGITPGSFSVHKEARLKELSEYCEFEDLGRKGIKVTKVIIPERKPTAMKIVKRDFKEAWEDNPNSLRLAAKYIYSKNKTELSTVKETTVYQYTCATKREWYGVSAKKNYGTKGYCNKVYAVIDYEKDRFRYLTEEENKIRVEMMSRFFKDSAERIEEVAKLKDSLKDKEITLEEYVELTDNVLGIAENGDWDTFNHQFMEAIGEQCDFALEFIDAAFTPDSENLIEE